jgi:CheY-like chemotaxis protein
VLGLVLVTAFAWAISSRSSVGGRHLDVGSSTSAGRRRVYGRRPLDRAVRVYCALGRMTQLKVLVAEADPETLRSLSREMRNLGFAVIEACDGSATWQLAMEHAPDLVIADLELPGMSGWEVYKRIRTYGATGGMFARTGFIMLCDTEAEMAVYRQIEGGPDRLLRTQVAVGDLVDSVRETLAIYGRSLPAGQ